MVKSRSGRKSVFAWGSKDLESGDFVDVKASRQQGAVFKKYVKTPVGKGKVNTTAVVELWTAPRNVRAANIRFPKSSRAVSDRELKEGW